jgi:RHS repeat-associated protein
MAFAILWPVCGVATVVRPSGATDAFGYDGLGNWTTYTNAEGRVYTMAYDALGRLVAATNALGQQVFANRYDAVGNLTNRTDGAGNTVVYRYDELNRLVSRSAGSAQSAVLFSHDPVGNLLTASNATASHSFAYDAMDRLTGSVSRVSVSPVSSFEFPVSYSRDAGGLVTNLVYAPGKAVARTYDPDGRLASVSDWHGRTWTFAWDGAGKPTGGTVPGGVVATNHYDAAGRLSSWSVGMLAGRTIARDEAGLKTRDDITAGPLPVPSFVRYAENTFDAADRLVAANVRYGSHTNAAIAETYRYDGNGALTNLVSGSNAVFSAAYDPLGQLSSLRLCASALNLSCDPLGNRVVVGDRLWLPDHADPLKRPLIEADAATGEPLRYYLWGPGRLLGFIDAASGALTVAHCDEYGSVVALTDASGNTLHTAIYGPNGQDWGTTGTNPTPFAWLGGHGVQRVAVSDHLGPLYLTRYRLYSASLNRFLSSDPLGLAGGLNLYAYAEGDPLSYIDPLGLGAEKMWETGSYLGDVGQFFLGYGDAVAGTVGGLYNMVRHPVRAVQGLAGAIAHPVQTAKAVAESVADTWGSGNRGQGQIVGNALIAAATIAAPYAKAGGVTKAAAGSKGSTAISPYRYTRAGETFQHYGYAEQAGNFVGGLKPGGYATPVKGLTGTQAQSGLALPGGRPPPNAVYTVTPKPGTPIHVNPVTQPAYGRPGGLPEVQFYMGTHPGTVSGPMTIP